MHVTQVAIVLGGVGRRPADDIDASLAQVVDRLLLGRVQVARRDDVGAAALQGQEQGRGLRLEVDRRSRSACPRMAASARTRRPSAAATARFRRPTRTATRCLLLPLRGHRYLRGGRVPVRRRVAPGAAGTSHWPGRGDCRARGRPPVSRSPIDFGRALIDRIFPRGALILSVLSFVVLRAGIVRNRVFANTYGAGPELDAYNAAFRIPEIALDVLVAAGLTAPFVPIYSSLRRDDEGAANDFGRTVLTGADPRDDRRRRRDLRSRPRGSRRQIGAGFDARDARAVRDARPDQLLRPRSCSRRRSVWARSSSRTGVSCSTPSRRSSTRPGSSSARWSGAPNDLGIVATAWGAVAGAALHLGIRGDRHAPDAFRRPTGVPHSGHRRSASSSA